MNVVNLLDRQIYTFSQVDRILALRGGTSRRWINGYTRRGHFYQPVVREEPSDQTVVTWGEFVETRLLAEYREAGVRLFSLRDTVTALRREFGRYPLAQAAPFLQTDGREIVRRVEDGLDIAGDLRFVVARDGQTMLTTEAETFVDLATFDIGQVSRLIPDPAIPAVTTDPLRAFGDPAIGSVPTEILAEQVRAGDSEEFVAEQYDLPVEQVMAAVAFERHRAA